MTEGLCECGCGEAPNSGRRFISGHNFRGPRTEEQKQHLRTKGRVKHTPESRAKISRGLQGSGNGMFGKFGSLHPQYGMKRSEETCRKIGEASKDRYYSPESRRKMSESGKDRIFSEIHRTRIGRALEGREFSTEWCRKLSIAKGGNGVRKSDYPLEFDNDLKERIKSRDGYCCQNPLCTGRSLNLVVHHIDYSKSNSSEENLITLCVSCHSSVGGGSKGRIYYRGLFEDIVSKSYQCDTLAIGRLR